MNSRPTLDEFFPLLQDIENAPLDLCKAAYDMFDVRSPGWQMPHLYEFAFKFKSTRAVLESLFPGMELEKYKPEHFKDFMLCIEMNVRMVNGTASLK
jgi:hypothetical protein